VIGDPERLKTNTLRFYSEPSDLLVAEAILRLDLKPEV
jgi:hypothetical protein